MRYAPKLWIGPALALGGACGIALVELQSPGSRTLVSWWVLERALTAERALPLLGLGAGLALLSRAQIGLSVILFILGTWLGFYFHDRFVAAMAFVPNAADHLFLTGPIAVVASGLLLIVPDVLRRFLAPVAALIVGAMLAQTIMLTDPTMNSWTVSIVGVGLGLWVVATTLICVRTFARSWFPIGLRIVGSWLLAIGLLYGSAAFIKRQSLPSSASDDKLMLPPEQNDLPDIDTQPAAGPHPEEFPAQP